jgi:hypothetical protein
MGISEKTKEFEVNQNFAFLIYENNQKKKFGKRTYNRVSF